MPTAFTTALTLWIPSVRGLAHMARHVVLDLAHPLPEHIEVSVGPSGSLQQYMVVYVVAAVDGIHGRVQTVEGDTVTLRDDYGSATGTLAVCRYLGRLWRLYPVDPHNALCADEWLEMLGQRIDASALSCLEESLEGRTFLGGFVALSIADVCWHAALCWKYGRGWEGDDETFPNLSRWFRNTKMLLNPTAQDGEEDCDEEDCDEEDCGEEDCGEEDDEDPRGITKHMHVD